MKQLLLVWGILEGTGGFSLHLLLGEHLLVPGCPSFGSKRTMFTPSWSPAAPSAQVPSCPLRVPGQLALHASGVTLVRWDSCQLPNGSRREESTRRTRSNERWRQREGGKADGVRSQVLILHLHLCLVFSEFPQPFQETCFDTQSLGQRSGAEA